MSQGAAVRRFPRTAALVAPVLLLAASCNDRFEFDIPSASSGTAGAPAGSSGTSGGDLGGSSSGVGGANAGSGASLAGQGGSLGSGCGTLPLCPDSLRCVDGACYECATDLDCSEAGLPRCDPKRHRCVACLQKSDCTADFTCDALANRCLRTCSDEMACPEDLHGCDESRSVCYECDEDHECEDSTLGALCASDGSGCVQCRNEADCPGQHCDQLSGRCVACRDGHDCVSGLCEPRAGSCL